MTQELITANHAAGMAATLAGRANRTARGFGSGVYPITPQTEAIELLCAQEIEKGRVIRVESEHSAMAVCMGVSMAGARAFTASSSNGLAYMAENVVAAALYRLPIVMMAVNRTLGPPWNIWVEHNDTLMLRDAGWLQFYCEDNQEMFDTILACYRVCEDRRVLAPGLVCQDAFVLSHTAMATEIPGQELVDSFLPPLDLPHRLTHTARTVGGLDFPHECEVHRRLHHEAMLRAFDVYKEAQADFKKIFGRELADPLVPYKMDDAEIAIVTMGTMACTARAAVDDARAKGIRVGAVRVRMYRPWPEAILRELLSGVGRIGVLDRNISPGSGGILWSDVRGCVERRALVQDYILGLGGGDVRPHHIGQIIEDLGRRTHAEAPICMEVA